MDKQKQLVVLGSGGHGWISIKEYINSYEGYVHIIFLPVDWGGSTGTIGRIFQMNNGELNSKLHNDSQFPTLPFGDMNKFIISYILQECPEHSKVLYKGKNINILDLRSDSVRVLIQTFDKLSKCIQIDNALINEFYEYLNTYIDFYLEHKDDIPEANTTSLGNIWHAFLYYRLGSLQNIIHYYQQKNIIPQHISVSFSSEYNQILQGTYFNEESHKHELNGEDLIDCSEFPIDPESYHLVNTHINQSIISSNALDILKKSDEIIIPNGSISNWLPLVNIPEVCAILVQKSAQGRLVWVMNLFHSKNEFPFDVYYHYLNIKNINPIIIGPKDVPAQYYVTFLKAYQKEGKTLNYNFNTTPHTNTTLEIGFNNCLDVVLGSEGSKVEGVKYDIDNVKYNLSKFLPIH